MDMFQLQMIWAVGLVIFYILPIIHIVLCKKIDSWEKSGWVLLTVFLGLIGYAIFLVVVSQKPKVNKQEGENYVNVN